MRGPVCRSRVSKAAKPKASWTNGNAFQRVRTCGLAHGPACLPDNRQNTPTRGAPTVRDSRERPSDSEHTGLGPRPTRAYGILSCNPKNTIKNQI